MTPTVEEIVKGLTMADAELIEFAMSFREGILDGGPSDMMCAAVCWPLAALLRYNGVSCESAEAFGIETDFGECNHVWIRLADGRVLDPTADQFNTEDGPKQYPPVYLGPPTELHRAPPVRTYLESMGDGK